MGHVHASTKIGISLLHELRKSVQVFFNFRYIQIKTLLMINNDGCITGSIYMLHWTTKYIKMK